MHPGHLKGINLLSDTLGHWKHVHRMYSTVLNDTLGGIDSEIG